MAYTDILMNRIVLSFSSIKLFIGTPSPSDIYYKSDKIGYLTIYQSICLYIYILPSIHGKIRTINSVKLSTAIFFIFNQLILKKL